jgi:acyl carrier protein
MGDVVKLVEELEKAFGIEIPNRDAETLVMVGNSMTMS